MEDKYSAAGQIFCCKDKYSAGGRIILRKNILLQDE